MRTGRPSLVSYEAVGICLGLLFVLAGTATRVIQAGAQFTLSNCVAAQLSQPLLWMIDVAPFAFFGAAWLFGKREMSRHHISEALRQLVDERSAELVATTSFTKAIFDNSGHAILAADCTGIITAVNPSAERILGYRAEELIGQDMCILHDTDEIVNLGERIMKSVGAARHSATPPSDVVFVRKDGKRIILELTSGAQFSGPDVVGFFEIGVDVTEERAQARELAEMAEQLRLLNVLLEKQHEELEKANSQLEESALVDDLTGVHNKRHFDVRLENMLHACVREGIPMSLIMLDVDRFKRYNDHFGHSVGDQVLRAIGDAMRSVCRPGDLAARVGGEEFAVLMPLTDKETAAVIAEKLRVEIESIEGLPNPVTASLGVATSSPSILTPEELFSAADRALYRAKRTGRNLVVEDWKPETLAA